MDMRVHGTLPWLVSIIVIGVMAYYYRGANYGETGNALGLPVYSKLKAMLSMNNFGAQVSSYSGMPTQHLNPASRRFQRGA